MKKYYRFVKVGNAEKQGEKFINDKIMNKVQQLTY